MKSQPIAVSLVAQAADLACALFFPFCLGSFICSTPSRSHRHPHPTPQSPWARRQWNREQHRQQGAAAAARGQRCGSIAADGGQRGSSARRICQPAGRSPASASAPLSSVALPTHVCSMMRARMFLHCVCVCDRATHGIHQYVWNRGKGFRSSGGRPKSDAHSDSGDSSAAAEIGRRQRHAEMCHANATTVVTVDACSPLHRTCA